MKNFAYCADYKLLFLKKENINEIKLKATEIGMGDGSYGLPFLKKKLGIYDNA
jgi:hypothetical protein